MNMKSGFIFTLAAPRAAAGHALHPDSEIGFHFHDALRQNHENECHVQNAPEGP
jgi:hypothetical protein